MLSASTVLEDRLFKLWRRHWPLDDPMRGCWMKSEEMAPLVGWSARKVEEGRRELVAYGLLERLPGNRYPAWHCFVPPECWPRGRKADFAEQVRLAVVLDAWLRDNLATANLRDSGGKPEPPTHEKRGGGPRSQPTKIGGLVAGAIHGITGVGGPLTHEKPGVGPGGKGGDSFALLLPVFQLNDGGREDRKSTARNSELQQPGSTLDDGAAGTAREA